jgi:hypothetical protein
MLLEKLLLFPTQTSPRFCLVFQKPAQPVFKNQLNQFLKTSSSSLKTGSTGFCTIHFFPASLLCQPKAVRSFLKNRFNLFGTGSAGFDSGPPTS